MFVQLIAFKVKRINDIILLSLVRSNAENKKIVYALPYQELKWDFTTLEILKC